MTRTSALLALLLIGFAGGASADGEHYTPDFAVEISGGPEVAQRVAAASGFTIVARVAELGDVYHLRHGAIAARSKRSADDHMLTLLADENVKYVEQQRILARTKRRAVVRGKTWIEHNKKLPTPTILHNRDRLGGEALEAKEHVVAVEQMGINFNDPEFPRQWYLINRGQTDGPVGYDLNVLPAWKKNITGHGVVVCVMDDGLDHNHPDLAPNYDPQASADFNSDNGRGSDPAPKDNFLENSHGTQCAGEIAAVANNSVCGVGVAFNAKIGGIRILDGPVTDMLEARGLLYNNQHVDIYSASWGPPDNGKSMSGPQKYATQALKEGATNGRGGKGSLYAWATGNGRGKNDSCSADGFVNNIYTIPIGSLNEDGLSSYYSEMCPAVFAVVFVGGSHAKPGDSDYKASAVNTVTTRMGADGSHLCDSQFVGTSAAAPLAAGCMALTLQANPNLTWRDMQNIIVETARIPNIHEEGWFVNGGGYHVNHHFGFGAMDCSQMVEAAQRWKTVPEQKKCKVPSTVVDKIVIPGESSVEYVLNTDGCEGSHQQIDRLEHVRVYVKISTKVRGNIQLSLTSPHGTISELLPLRVNDKDADGLDWTLLTVHSWGENPKGHWNLTVHNADKEDAKLLKASIMLRGTQGKNINAMKQPEKGRPIDILSSIVPNARGHNQDLKIKLAEGYADAHEIDTPELTQFMHAESKAADNVNILHAKKRGSSELNEQVLIRRNFDHSVRKVFNKERGLSEISYHLTASNKKKEEQELDMLLYLLKRILK